MKGNFHVQFLGEGVAGEGERGGAVGGDRLAEDLEIAQGELAERHVLVAEERQLR